jgi:hypothetical protein
MGRQHVMQQLFRILSGDAKHGTVGTAENAHWFVSCRLGFGKATPGTQV